MKPLIATGIAALLGLVAVTGRAAPAAGQEVSGAVSSQGRPVVGATVRLLELDRVERTGAQGRFLFRDVPPGTYRVSASLIGYAPATDMIRATGRSTTVSLELAPSAIPIEGVVVTGSPTPRPAGEQYQPAETKSQSELDNSPGMSFAEKISDMPGVAVRGNGSAPTRPIVRGLGDNEVLVLENGLRMGDIATYDPAHATPIEAMSIAQVDVVRGPASILYGPNTIGGLVNVVTNLVPTPSDRPVSGTAALEASSESDELSGYVDNVFTAGRSAFRVSVGGLHSGDIRVPGGTYVDPGSGAPFQLDRIPQSFDHIAEGGLGYSYQGPFGMVGLGGNYYQSNYGIPGVPPNPDWETVPPTTSRIAQIRRTLELRSLFDLQGSWLRQVDVDASYNDYTHSEFPTAQDSSGVSDPLANHFHMRELNGVLQLHQQARGRLSGTLGLWGDLQDLTIEGDQPLGPNSLTTDVAAYAYEEYAAGRDTRLQAGLRYDLNRIATRPFAQSPDSVFQTLDVSRQHGAMTASLGAVQHLGPELTASLSLARSFRAPTVQELFANGLDAASGTYSIGAAGLGPETGLGIDAALKGQVGRAGFEISPYLNYLSNYIYGFLRGDTIQDFPVRQFGATRARLFGFEATAFLQPLPSLLLRASSDYVNAQDTRNGQPLPFIPPLRGLLGITYQGDRYDASAEVRMAARQDRLGVGDTPTAGYAVLNLGAGLRLVRGGMVSQLSLRANNIFDQVYRDNLSVIKDFLPQPGRALQLDYQVFF